MGKAASAENFSARSGRIEAGVAASAAPNPTPDAIASASAPTDEAGANARTSRAGGWAAGGMWAVTVKGTSDGGEVCTKASQLGSFDRSACRMGAEPRH